MEHIEFARRCCSIRSLVSQKRNRREWEGKKRNEKKNTNHHVCCGFIFIPVYFRGNDRRKKSLTLQLLHTIRVTLDGCFFFFFSLLCVGFICLCETSTKLKNQTFYSQAIRNEHTSEKGTDRAERREKYENKLNTTNYMCFSRLKISAGWRTAHNTKTARKVSGAVSAHRVTRKG